MAWICVGIGVTMAYLVAFRSLYTLNRDSLAAPTRSRGSMLLVSLVGTSTITLATGAFAYGVIAYAGHLFHEDLDVALIAVRLGSYLLPVVSVAQGVSSYLRTSRPDPTAPIAQRIRARGLAYVILLAPAAAMGLIGLLGRAVDPINQPALAGLQLEAWKISLVATCLGLPCLGLIAWTDERRVRRARELTLAATRPIS